MSEVKGWRDAGARNRPAGGRAASASCSVQGPGPGPGPAEAAKYMFWATHQMH